DDEGGGVPSVASRLACVLAAGRLEDEAVAQPPAARPNDRDDGEREGDVPGPLAVCPPTARVHVPHRRRVEPDAGTEGEAPAVDAAERDPPHARGDEQPG